MITIGSLFSGIGGLELGVLAAFAEAGIPARVEWQVEIDPFCRAALARHFPDTDRSVTDVRAASALRPVNLIIGGFPCQDVSGAGKGEGLSGARSGLWWAYRDVVRALRPDGVLVENVVSGLSRWHGPVRCSLEALGYRTWARQISAADVGAPHRRARLFVLAHADGERRVESQGGQCDERGWAPDGGAVSDAEYDELRLESRRCSRANGGGEAESRDAREGMGHASGARREGALDSGAAALRGLPPRASGGLWEAQSGLGRNAHGLSAGLDRRVWVESSESARHVGLPDRWPAGRGEEQRAWEPPRTVAGKEPLRRSRLKALGNAVVPAQGREAMRWALDVLRGAA